MHKVAHGERKRMYGWELVGKLTRSEFEEGGLPEEFSNYDLVVDPAALYDQDYILFE